MRLSIRRTLGLVLACSSTTASSSSASTAPPNKFGMLVYRAFEMLDVFGPLEVLGTLAKYRQLNLYLIAETMDPVTTEPVAAAMNPEKSSFVSCPRSGTPPPRTSLAGLTVSRTCGPAEHRPPEAGRDPAVEKGKR